MRMEMDSILHLIPKIKFRMVMHMSGEKCHSIRYTNDAFGIGYEVHTFGSSKKGFFEPSKRKQPKLYFYLEKQAGEYETLTELLVDHSEIVEKIRQWDSEQQKKVVALDSRRS